MRVRGGQSQFVRRALFARVDHTFCRVSILGICLVLSPATRATAQLETILLTGDAALDGPAGAIFQEFGLANVNDHGAIEFAGGMQPGVAGVTIDTAVGFWTYSAGELTAVLVGDPPAPGAEATFFETVVTAPLFSNSGALFADFRLETGAGGVTTNNDDGGWLFSHGVGELVYRENQSLPGFPADAELFFGAARMNAHGDLVVSGRFREGIGGMTATNNRGLWIRTAGSLNLIAQTGTAAAGAPAGAILHSFGISTFNDQGVVTSTGTLREGFGGVTSANSEVVYSNRSGVFSLEYREGGTATGGTVFDLFSAVRGNDGNRLAIDATLKSGIGGVSTFNNRGIWVEEDGGLREVVRTDAAMPGVDGRKFRAFSNLLFNDAGHVAFAASSGSPNTFDTIFSDASGALTLVARAGRAASGTNPGVLFDFDHLDFIGIPRLNFNNAGQVAFISGLSGTGVTAANDLGLWAQNGSGVLQLIVREGNTIEVAPGDSRTVETFNFGNMNERGQIVFNAKFTDGSFGLFLSNLVAQLPGDFNGDGTVDTADYTTWRDGLGDRYDAEDYADWKANFGTSLGSGNVSGALQPVPEPAAIASATILLMLGAVRRRPWISK